MASAALAFLFPGQGSQFVGMGRSLYDREPASRALFEQADEILGRSLSGLCFEGPEEALKETINQQPALFVCSAAACEALRARGLEPAWAAGHSLGEYAALYAAGVFDFATGLRLVARRGEAMAETGAAVPGAMAAVMGLDIPRLETLCEQASEGGGIAVVANDNSPGQTVISGSPAAVERACNLAREAGARRALPLPVSGAFHSPLVAPAQEAMRAALAEAELRAPRCRFIPNVTASQEDDPDAIRDLLLRQIVSRVRWVDTVARLGSAGVKTALEVGPGKVLAGLVKRIDGEMTVHAAGEADAIEEAVAALG